MAIPKDVVGVISEFLSEEGDEMDDVLTPFPFQQVSSKYALLLIESYKTNHPVDDKYYCDGINSNINELLKITSQMGALGGVTKETIGEVMTFTVDDLKTLPILVEYCIKIGAIGARGTNLRKLKINIKGRHHVCIDIRRRKTEERWLEIT